MENRIKECQLDLFADRTSAATMRANQLRLWFASMAYVLLCALHHLALQRPQFAKATCGTIRLKLLEIGALVRISVRRITFGDGPWGCPINATSPVPMPNWSPPRRADETESASGDIRPANRRTTTTFAGTRVGCNPSSLRCQRVLRRLPFKSSTGMEMRASGTRRSLSKARVALTPKRSAAEHGWQSKSAGATNCDDRRALQSRLTAAALSRACGGNPDDNELVRISIHSARLLARHRSSLASTVLTRPSATFDVLVVNIADEQQT